MTNLFIPKLLVVLHETVIDCQRLLEYHQSGTFEASYHVCIARNGKIVYLVPANLKALAAKNSRYINVQGEIEEINGSVDDFAYHIALESPEDGRDSTLSNHSGYTLQQYKSLCWLLKNTGVERERVVTHDEVRIIKEETKDPRSLNKIKLNDLLDLKNSKKNIDFGILN